MLPERRTGTTLGDMQLRSDLLNAGTPTRGAYKFPRAASCRMSFSNVRSEIALRSRFVLELKLLQPPYLFDLQSAEFLPPAIVGHLAHTDLTDCIRPT